jgi:hypothetical protein
LDFDNCLELCLVDSKWFFSKEQAEDSYINKRPAEHPYRKNKNLLSLIEAITSMYIDNGGMLPNQYVIPYLALFPSKTLTYYPSEKKKDQMGFPFFSFGNFPKIFKWDKYNGSLKFKPINRLGRFISLTPQCYLSELYNLDIEKELAFRKE